MDDDLTWRILSSRNLLTDRWIDVRADRCLMPNGTEIDPYYVLHYTEWANVVAITDADELVLIRQYRHASGRTHVELPGGMVDPGEAPEAAAVRELLEETGYAGAVMRPVFALHANPAIQTNRLHAFAIENVQRVRPPSLEAAEHGLSVVLMPLAAILPRLHEPVVEHAMHASALLHGLAALGRISFAPTAPPPPRDPRAG